MQNQLIKTAAFAALLSLIAAPAFADPVLRGEVTVSSAVVTVGDMFENAGLAAEKAIFRSPAPGTTGVLSLEDVSRAARAAGIEQFNTAGFHQIRVARPGVVVQLPMLSDLIEADLESRGILTGAMKMRLSLDEPLPMLTAADTETPLSLDILRYMPGSSSFAARFAVAGLDAPLDVSGQIQITVEAPHLARTLPAGSIIQPDDVEMRMVPLNYAETTGLVAIEDIVGKQLQRQTRAGVMIRPSDVAAPEIISRNETVTITYRQGALTLTTRGKALNSASLSEPVSVLNTMTNKVLQGTATGQGAVTISAGNQQVAGL